MDKRIEAKYQEPWKWKASSSVSRASQSLTPLQEELSLKKRESYGCGELEHCISRFSEGEQR